MADRLVRSARVPARALNTISFVHRESSDIPYIRAVEACRGSGGMYLSTHDHPLVTASEAGTSMPTGWSALYRSMASASHSLGARVLLTGQNGDLVMGNWFDDSLQVAAAIRRGAITQAAAEALAWSKATRIPAPRLFTRAIIASLPARLTADALFATTPPHHEDCLDPAFRTRTTDAASWTAWADPWHQAPPERRNHFRALALVREMRSLRRFEELHDVDYTHPFAHRPLVEFLLSIPADVLCRAGEPRRLMRRALSDLWPAALRARRSKSLFGAPWVAALRPLVQEMLATSTWQVVERGWIAREPTRRKFQQLAQGIGADDPQTRQIVLLEYWLRNHGCKQRQPTAA
jgi:asparagine synthase (glutamine-hydrolysing)